MKVGFNLPTRGRTADPGMLRDTAVLAEELGFDSIWVSDHIVIPTAIASQYPYTEDRQLPAGEIGPFEPYLEALVALTYLASCTRSVRLGTHVLILPYRNPVLTAKMVATLDVLSGGRVDLGIGVGWMREEFEAVGQLHFDRRGELTDEQIRIMKAIWTADLASFSGTFYQFSEVGAYPHPIQQPHPPLWIGGHSRAAIRRVARLANGWQPVGAAPNADLPPAEIAAKLDELHAEARRVGRDHEVIGVRLSVGVDLTERANSSRQQPAFHGSPEKVADDIRRYQAVGVDRLLVGFFGASNTAQMHTSMRQFAEQVLPALADA